MRIYNVSNESWTFEPGYNTVAKRFFPWDGMAAHSWGGAWVKVLPGETSTAHSHSENEIFFVVEGVGALSHGDERHRIAWGTTAYMDPNTEHSITNDGDEGLVFLSVWWDGPIEGVPAV